MAKKADYIGLIICIFFMARIGIVTTTFYASILALTGFIGALIFIIRIFDEKT